MRWNAARDMSRNRAERAFLIRIEDIKDDFESAFEVGNADALADWMNSGEDAWFFLDSVDEARLDSPHTFEKAIRHFAGRIKSAQHRARIFISSRPFAWRAPVGPRPDRAEFAVQETSERKAEQKRRSHRKGCPSRVSGAG